MNRIETFYSEIEGCQKWRVWFGNVGWLYDTAQDAERASKVVSPIPGVKP